MSPLIKFSDFMGLTYLSGIWASFNPANPIITIKIIREAEYPIPADVCNANFETVIKIIKSITEHSDSVISRVFLFITPQVWHQ